MRTVSGVEDWPDFESSLVFESTCEELQVEKIPRYFRAVHTLLGRS